MVATMAGTPTITPEQRETIIREWVVALPAERRAICAKYDISQTLPYFWRNKGYFPKDLIVPPPKPVEPPPPIPLAVTAGAPASALKPEEREDLGKRFKSLPYSERAAFAKTIGIGQSSLYEWGAGRRLITKLGRPTTEGLGLTDEQKRALGQGLLKAKDKPAFAAEAKQKIGTLYRWARLPAGKSRFGGTPGKRVRLTTEKKLELVKEIDALRAKGLDVSEACVKVGLKSSSKYHTWKRGEGLAQPGTKLGTPPWNGPKNGPKTPEERLRRVAEVDKLRAGGMPHRQAIKKVPGISSHSYHVWKLYNGHPAHKSAQKAKVAQKAPAAPRALVPTAPKGKAALALALSNRALQRANGSPQLASPVGELVKRFVQELAAMGAEIQEIKNNQDGHCTVVVKHTETIDI